MTAMAGGPSFSIPVRPERRFPFRDSLQYEGATTFHLRPDERGSEAALVSLLEAVLSAGPYRYGNFYDVPLPLYLLRDEETGDVFRVSVRDGTVRLHVLPETEPPGLRALYERLDEASETTWTVECRSELPEGGETED